MRLFVGIPLAAETKAELSAVVSRLQSRGGAMRWSAPDSWHITLQFLGNAAPEQLQCLTEHLGAVRSAPVSVQIGELGSFDHAGAFFADVKVSPALAALQERVVEATGQCGFAAETRPFHPHITLARKTGNRNQETREQESQRTREQGSKNAGSGARVLQDLLKRAGVCCFTRFSAHEFLLYESHLSSEGSRYEVRARFPIGA
jgi:RNA 2',3'-cyclic 3'-phosphodiesterase